MTVRSKSAPLILVGQPVHASIDEDAMLPALGPDEAACPRRVVVIDAKDPCDTAVATQDWTLAEQAVRAEFDVKLREELDRDAAATLHYFGAAPIPAAMLLGFLVGSWARVVPHLRHHDSRDWLWPSRSDGERPPKLRERHGPSGAPVLADGDVVVRVATSLAVDLQSTRDVVPKPLAEFEIALEELGLDALASADEVEMVSREFRALLDAIAQTYPNATTIHVFAAVPVGLAFRMGTLVSPTMHATVQTYYFDRKASPQQIAAIPLQTPRPTRAPITDDAREAAAEMRQLWASELTRIASYAGLMRERAQREGLTDWLDFVLPASADAETSYGGRWLELTPLHETVLANSTVDTAVSQVASDFDYRTGSRTWVFDDGLLSALAKRLTESADRARAGRMLLFHEGVHLAAQTVTRHTSNMVGRFPKVLEAIDYSADVWAMLNEYAMARHLLEADAHDARQFMLRLIGTATETFWAFDAGAGPLREIQVRRMNRYLLWYWQQLRIEHAVEVNQVFPILAEQPVLELAGPRLRTRGERVWYSLDAREVTNLEICVLHKSALHRHATGPASDLSLVLDGFRSRNGELVKEGLRGIFAQAMRSG
jgi:hypothetical protein